MDENHFNPDEFLNNNASQNPPGSIASDPLQVEQFNPDDYLAEKGASQAQALQEQFGTIPQQALAGIEAFGRGSTFGTSGLAETKLGLTTPEAMAARAEANPWTAGLGTLAGGAALIGGTGGVAAPIAGALGGGLAATGAGLAAEGGAFGLGNTISDLSMGDPNINAQKILSDLGMGAAIGVGLGALGKGISRIPALFRATEGTPVPVVDIPVKEDLIGQPSSTAEMAKRVQEAIKYGGQENLLELPEKQVAIEARDRLGTIGLGPTEFPITDYQLDSLNNQAARNEYKQNIELGGKAGKTIADYESAQKKALTNTLDRSIQQIAPDYEVTTDAADAGQRVNEILTTNDQAIRDQLAPAFEQIKSTPLNDVDHLPQVINYLTDTNASQYANPKIANMFDTSGDGVEFKPYSTSMGIDQGTYRAVKQAVNALKENPDDFEKLFDIRKGLSQNIDVTSAGDAPSEIGSAKAAMMDYIQDAVQEHDPDLQVRDTFKKWAQNEQNKEFLQNNIKAQVGTDWRSLDAGRTNPEENVLNRIFSNSTLTDAVKGMMSPEQWNQTLADHMAILKNRATDNGVFSSSKFNSLMRGKQAPLDVAFQDNPGLQQRIQDATTLLRIFPDTASANPPHTARTLIKGMIDAGFDPVKQLSNVLTQGKEKLGELRVGAQINQKLAETADQSKKLATIQNIINRVNGQIKSGVKAIFSDTGKNSVRGGALALGTQLSDSEYDKHVEALRKFSSNPQGLMDHMAENTEDLTHSAPNITQGINTSVMNAVGFLNSKIPKPLNTLPLSHEWKPNTQQKTQFNSYYNAVNDPVSALKEVKNGTLTSQTMEALKAVHPHLLQEMQKEVLGQIKPEKARDMPYSKKLALGKFLGQPMDGNMLPQNILSIQQALNFNISQQSGAKTGRKTSLGGLKQLNISALTKTKTQGGEEE